MRRQDGVCSEFIRLMACLNSLCGWMGVFNKSVALLLVHSFPKESYLGFFVL